MVVLKNISQKKLTKINFLNILYDFLENKKYSFLFSIQQI
jgi:hypothetical protein